MSKIIKTVETDSDHHTIGGMYLGWNGQYYLCDSWEENAGYWMTNVADPSDRRNVSERAIGCTFHRKYDYDENHKYILGLDGIHSPQS